MKQIVEEVLQAEAVAAATIKAAREQAASLTAKAEAASLDRINEAKQQCQQQMQAIIHEAIQAADRVRAEMVQQAEKQAQDIRARNPARLDQLVDRICAMVVGIPAGNGAQSPPADQ